MRRHVCGLLACDVVADVQYADVLLCRVVLAARVRAAFTRGGVGAGLRNGGRKRWRASGCCVMHAARTASMLTMHDVCPSPVVRVFIIVFRTTIVACFVTFALQIRVSLLLRSARIAACELHSVMIAALLVAFACG
jgi:hypothetical protein